jgi:hypothetical protein
MLLQHGFGRTARFWYSLIPILSRPDVNRRL